MKKAMIFLLMAFLFLPLSADRTRSLFSYTQVKYGFQLAPSHDSLGQKWLVGVEIQRRLNPFMAVSFEIMPFYRNSEALESTLLAAYGFINLKLGYKPLDFLGFYCGFGAGGRLGQSWVDVDGQTFSKLSLDWGWHAFAGLTFQFDFFSILLEFHRLVESLTGLNEPNTRHYLMLGFGF